MSATVAQWTHYAQEAERRYGIPAAVLLGLIEVESGGKPGQTSGAGAEGITQFMPDTARAYGVDTRPGHERSQVMGAAHYLADLGFAKDPTGALRKYNGGTNGPRISSTLTYARKVLAAARKYTGATGTKAPSAPAGPTAGPATPAASSGSGDPSWALRALVTVGLIGLGLALVLAGGGRAVGVDVAGGLARGARRTAKATAVAVPK